MHYANSSVNNPLLESHFQAEELPFRHVPIGLESHTRHADIDDLADTNVHRGTEPLAQMEVE